MTGVYQNTFVLPSKCKEYHTEYASRNREHRRNKYDYTDKTKVKSIISERGDYVYIPEWILIREARKSI